MNEFLEKTHTDEARYVVFKHYNRLVLSLIIDSVANRVISVVLLLIASLAQYSSFLGGAVIIVAALLFAYSWQTRVKALRDDITRLEESILGSKDAEDESKWRTIFIEWNYQAWTKSADVNFLAKWEPYSWCLLTIAAVLINAAFTR